MEFTSISLIIKFNGTCETYVTNLRKLPQTGSDNVFIRLLTETGDCGGRLPLVPHS